MCSLYELRCKEVININDGQRLGSVSDIGFDIETLRITHIIIYGRAKFFGLLGREEDICIDWHDIDKIGHDIILVRVDIRIRPKKKTIRNYFRLFFR